MHSEALHAAIAFKRDYLGHLPGGKILDVGSYDVNGTLRPLFNQPAWDYIGIDRQDGPGVDVVWTEVDAHLWPGMPFESNMFDVAVSTSAFEHDHMWWLTLGEMARVVKPGGWVYVCAPSQGAYHAYPKDYYRFFTDTWWGFDGCMDLKTLRTWYAGGEWNDAIGVFTVTEPKKRKKRKKSKASKK